MHLTKDEIKQIAYKRFNDGHIKYLYFLLFGPIVAVVAFTLAFGHLFPENIWPAIATDIPILALWIVGIFRYGKAQERATKEFIKQCEANPHLIYVPDGIQAPETASQPTEIK
jgi:hypothetical protein